MVSSASGPVIVCWFGSVKFRFDFDVTFDYVSIIRIIGAAYLIKASQNHGYAFPAPTVYRLLAKMIQHGIVNAAFVKKLKF